MRAACYLRELPEPTLDAQHRAFVAYCDDNGLEAGPAFTDTGDLPGASEFRRMLRLLARGERGFTVVAVAALAVLGDGVREQALRYLQLAAAGLPLRLADGRDPDEALLDAWRTRRPGERRRERARESMRKRALRGEPQGRPPYGYRITARRLEPAPEEALVVRRIFDAYLGDGDGVRRIAQRLNGAGLHTRRGGPWSMGAVRDVLRNPVYTGTYRRLGVVVPRAHEPIVAKRRFEAAQRLRAARRTTAGPQRRRRYLLSGLARCGYCGSRLIGARRQSRRSGARSGEEDGEPGEYRYYQCGSRASQGRCAYHTRRADELEESVRRRLVAPPDRDEPAPAEAPAGEQGDGERRVEARRRARQRKIDRMLELRASGRWTAQQLRSAAAGLAPEELADEAAHGDAAARPAPGESDEAPRRQALAAARARLAERWDGLDFEQRRRLLTELVSAVIVTDDDVRVQFAA